MKIISLALVAATSLSICAMQHASLAAAGQPVAKRLTVRATISPNQPNSKGVEKILVRVSDAAGKPVSGAMVKVSTSMPTMSMKGADLSAHDSGRGTYTADARLNYATKWAIDITANAKGRSGTTHIERDVQ